MAQDDGHGLYLVLKRLLDICVSFSLLIILAPMMICVALLVAGLIGLPVLFVQERPGWHGLPFRVFKFRTMTDAVDRAGAPLPDADRLTRLGSWLRRLSLDELPQLINVLKGEMSLVGPRPLLMEYLPLYTAEQARRHEARPGITGWAQINGRNAIDWEKRLELDVWYVDHASFLLDMKILAATFAKVVGRHGVSAPGEATVSKFRGSTGMSSDEQALGSEERRNE
jgi:lipopolysaccharide/colanic/teichoic acid biosynthesis glycosyltransferase